MDGVYVDRDETLIIYYSYKKDESADLETMTVQELMDLVTRKATLS
ncbi:hypothetical protein [Salinicoccus roseus]|nr:hypothetical protein [Salinicoccus roseus]